MKAFALFTFALITLSAYAQPPAGLPDFAVDGILNDTKSTFFAQLSAANELTDLKTKAESLRKENKLEEEKKVLGQIASKQEFLKDTDQLVSQQLGRFPGGMSIPDWRRLQLQSLQGDVEQLRQRAAAPGVTPAQKKELTEQIKGFETSLKKIPSEWSKLLEEKQSPSTSGEQRHSPSAPSSGKGGGFGYRR